MPRTTVRLDDGLLKDARWLLGTRGISDTVNAALVVAIRQARLTAFDVRRFEITDDDIAKARAARPADRRARHADLRRSPRSAQALIGAVIAIS